MLASDASSPDYTDIAIRRGVTAHRPYVGDNSLPSTAWHPEFADVNNDGFIDLFVSKGNVDSMPEFTSSDPNNLFIGQPDGSFLEGGAEAGIAHDGKTRGAAVVDLNGDGLLDLIEVNRIAPVRVWRNVGRGTSTDPEPMGSWVDVVVNGSGINHARIGSWIEVRIGEYSTSDEITIGGGHASGSLGVHHFGLGPANKAEVRLVGPDGHTTPWQTVEAGRTIVIEVD